jgi:hypothetical protein
MFDRKKETIVAVLVLLAVVGGVIFAIVYRHKEVIVIDKRYYAYTKAYKWDSSYYVPVTKTSCTGTGKEQKCTSSTSLERKTSTHTRCEETNVGYELPTKPPEMTCDMETGDYVRETISYSIDYTTKDGNPGNSSFEAPMWDTLKPESKQVIVTDLFNRIVEIKYE